MSAILEKIAEMQTLERRIRRNKKELGNRHSLRNSKELRNENVAAKARIEELRVELCCANIDPSLLNAFVEACHKPIDLAQLQVDHLREPALASN